jgi:SagB-type dehydrogenase family enzyme
MQTATKSAPQPPPPSIELPEPLRAGRVSVEEAIAARRSTRSFGRRSLSLAEVGELLWAAQGITRADGHRAAPSAGALYPLSVHLVAERLEGAGAGAYAYEPAQRRLREVARGSLLARLVAAAPGQDWIADAAAALVVSAADEKLSARFGARAARFAHLEAGHAVENAHLEATALGLASVVVGAFDDDAVARLVRLGSGEEPLCLLIVGASP